MTDHAIAAIARDLAKALITRAKSRQPDDLKIVLALKTELVAAVLSELEPESFRPEVDFTPSTICAQSAPDQQPIE